MDKVLLVSVIALAVALLSMLVNLALVWKISDLKHQIEWLEKGSIDDLKYHLTKNMDKVTKLENDTKDAFEKLTNHLTRHDDEIDRVVKKYEEMETRVAKHTEQLEDLGNFAGITTGELRVLEQKIYNSCKPKELPKPEPIREQIEEASLRSKVTTNSIEIHSLGTRLSLLENKIKSNLAKQSESVTKIGELDHQVSDLCKGLDKVKLDMVYHTLALNSKINQVVGGKDVAPKEVKPDRKRKDNYYRRPNQVSVEKREDFSGDVFK